MLLYKIFVKNLFLNCKSCNFMAQYSVTIDSVQPRSHCVDFTCAALKMGHKLP